MRQWINLVESPNRLIVFHGDIKENVVAHRKMFFTTDESFAHSYGSYITRWELDTSRFIDSIDDDMVAEFLPLYDPYDDAEITTLDEYLARSSDTWEIIECDNVCDNMVATNSASGIIVYEGGIQNYLVYDPSCVKLIT